MKKVSLKQLKRFVCPSVMPKHFIEAMEVPKTTSTFETHFETYFGCVYSKSKYIKNYNYLAILFQIKASLRNNTRK